MARTKKKSLSQSVVEAAATATGMPAPVKKLLGGRLVALLIVLVLPVLWATGILSIRWENGRPHVSFNRQKAAEVRQEAVQRIEKATGRAPLTNIPTQLRGESSETVSERIKDAFEVLPASHGSAQPDRQSAVPVTQQLEKTLGEEIPAQLSREASQEVRGHLNGLKKNLDQKLEQGWRQVRDKL